MSRFVQIAGCNVNVDKIRSFWRTRSGNDSVLNIELDDGKILRQTDNHHAIENFLNGSDYIIQVIPCEKALYARFMEDQVEKEYPIYFLGLCADGYIRPLCVCGEENFYIADHASNYVGLYLCALEEENVQ